MLQARPSLSDSELITLTILDQLRNEARLSTAFSDPAVSDPLLTTYSVLMRFYHVLHRFELDEPLDFEAFWNLHGSEWAEVWTNNISPVSNQY